ncbi:hypothetical protein UCRPC4_g03185 [Phaeomoniella chlamydospora]|uniref:F-box domain-containing protein n=1 Tax=Phaeomoniella chlamydospora TaxID=158046 RepID=A0A0G2GGC8_PHACM|nr:hypothetical protein UCRPC4_g03185 [Phaeomoniella chlamydospora]
MSAARAGSLGQLPNEILLIVLRLLPIKDVISLQLATRGLLPALKERTDPCEYLKTQGPFTEASDLLEVMSSHGAVLSGSRALEWFVPDSCTNTSDWDFYVPPEPVAVTSVKHALERSGVQFETCLAQADRKLQREGAVTLNRKNIISIAYETYFSAVSGPADPRITRAIFQTYPILQDVWSYIRIDGSVRWIADLQPITIRADGSVTSIPQHSSNDDSQSYDHMASAILSGTARRWDQTVTIQLIVGELDPRARTFNQHTMRFQSVLKQILSFYASHVQCFLSKHVALHMYYRLAAEKISYRWQVPEIIRARADAAVQKYVHRGFQFKSAPENEGAWTPRAVLDDDSFVVELDSNCRLGIKIEPSQVRLNPGMNDPYIWKVIPGKEERFSTIFSKNLSDHSVGAYRELSEGVDEYFEALPSNVHDANVPASLISLKSPDLGFSAQISQLKEEKAKISQDLYEWRDKAVAESEGRAAAERDALQLCEVQQQLQKETRDYAVTVEHLRSTVAKWFQGLEEVMPILEELKAEVSTISHPV